MDILGYLKDTHKNPKFGKERRVPTRQFPTKFPGWDLSHSSKFGIFMGILLNTLKYPKMGNIICYFFLWQHWNFILPGLPFRTFCNMWNFQDSSQKHVYTDILHNLVNSCWKVVISLSANPMYLKVVLHCKHHNNDDSNKVNKQLVLSAKQQLCTWVIVFSTFLSCPLHDCDMKPPNAMFYGWCEHTTTNFPSSFWTW